MGLGDEHTHLGGGEQLEGLLDRRSLLYRSRKAAERQQQGSKYVERHVSEVG
jgi:hypothetical protein